MKENRYETIKHPDDDTKLILLDNEAETAEPVQIMHHMVYLRMTEREDIINGIYLPGKSKDDHCTFWEVIAVGRECGRFRRLEKRYKNVSEFCLNPETTYSVGDIVLIPEKATREGTGYQYLVKRSPASQYEGLVDEGLILAKIN